MAPETELDKKIEEKVEAMVNPIIEQLKDRLYPTGQAPLKAGPIVGLQMSQPPIISQPRPMMPAPPVPLPSARVRGIIAETPTPLRPKTQYALELEAKAAQMAGAPKRLCDACGGSKMVNLKRNIKREIIEYHACPKCIDCKVVEG